MIWFYILLLLAMTVFWIISKIIRVRTPLVEHSYSKPFLACAVLIHRFGERISLNENRYFKSREYVKNQRKLITQLQTLNPGEPADTQLYRYRVERTSTMILILFIGALMALVISFTAVKNRVLEEGDQIYRNTYGEVDMAVNLTAGIKNEDFETDELNIVIPARIYSHDEAEAMFLQMSEGIDEIILGENEDFNHVVYPLNLAREIEGYPFYINWECSDYEFLNTDGTLHNEELEKPVAVTLTADCVYQNEHRYIARTVAVCPQELTYEERVVKEILDAVKRLDSESSSDEKITLPREISYGELEWREKLDDNSSLVLLIALIICIIIIPVKEAEINRDIKKRSRQLMIEYPAFVSKLTLYIGSGMSVRNAFLRMGHEYELLSKRKKTNSGALGMELAIAAHELEMGISEAEVYEQLGKRCERREYMRFVALLTQNMKKGSTDLIRLLKKEADDAFDMRKNEARKLGEEASTKLLVPMIMMLGVVMVIIMVPAYMSFSS